MGLAYGYDVTGLDDRFVRLANTALHNFFKAAEPDWVVNVVPFGMPYFIDCTTTSCR